jgi:hypothetical protein
MAVKDSKKSLCIFSFSSEILNIKYLESRGLPLKLPESDAPMLCTQCSLSIFVDVNI